MKNKFFDVNFKLFPNYETATNRVILVEYENGENSEITLENNAQEPTLKLENGTVLLKGSNRSITLEGSPKSISTTQKFTTGTDEYDILVRKFVDSRQVCRALKSEIEKCSGVVHDPSLNGYRGNSSDGKNVMCYVEKKCLVVVTTTDKANTIIPEKNMNRWGIIKLIFGIALILFALWAFTAIGWDFRILFVVMIGIYYLSGGYTQLKESDDECPKFNV